MTQDSTSGQREMESSSSSSPGQMCQNQYGYGQSLPEAGSRSDETIVNDPSTTSSAPCESESPCCSKETCGCCCDIASSQQSGCSQWDQIYPGQQQHIFPVPMGVDPSTGFPIYCYSTPLNYQGNAMYSMPGMQMDESQREAVARTTGKLVRNVKLHQNLQRKIVIQMGIVLHFIKVLTIWTWRPLCKSTRRVFSNAMPLHNKVSVINKQP